MSFSEEKHLKITHYNYIYIDYHVPITDILFCLPSICYHVPITDMLLFYNLLVTMCQSQICYYSTIYWLPCTTDMYVSHICYFVYHLFVIMYQSQICYYSTIYWLSCTNHRYVIILPFIGYHLPQICMYHRYVILSTIYLLSCTNHRHVISSTIYWPLCTNRRYLILSTIYWLPCANHRYVFIFVIYLALVFAIATFGCSRQKNAGCGLQKATRIDYFCSIGFQDYGFWFRKVLLSCHDVRFV